MHRSLSKNVLLSFSCFSYSLLMFYLRDSLLFCILYLLWLLSTPCIFFGFNLNCCKGVPQGFWIIRLCEAYNFFLIFFFLSKFSNGFFSSIQGCVLKCRVLNIKTDCLLPSPFPDIEILSYCQGYHTNLFTIEMYLFQSLTVYF